MFEYLKSLDWIQSIAVISAIAAIITFLSMIVTIITRKIESLKRYLNDANWDIILSKMILHCNMEKTDDECINDIELRGKKIKAKKTVRSARQNPKQCQHAGNDSKQNQRVEIRGNKQNAPHNKDTKAENTQNDFFRLKQLFGFNSETEPLFIDLCTRFQNSEIMSNEDLKDYYTNSVLKDKYTNFTNFLVGFSIWLKIQTVIKDSSLSKKDIVKVEQVFNSIINKDKPSDSVSLDDKMSLIQQVLDRESDKNSAIKLDIQEVFSLIKENQKQSEYDRRINRIALFVSAFSLIATVFFSFSTNKQSDNEFRKLDERINNVEDVIESQNKNTVDTIITLFDKILPNSTDES